MNKKTIMMWAPLAFSLIFGILAVSLHHIACPEVIPSVYIQAPLYAIVPVIFPLLEKFAKIKIPYFLVVIVTVQIIISVDLGTALNFYAFIPNYDKFLHTYFGAWCAQLIYYFINLWGGQGMKMWGRLLLVMLSVLGVAAIWEISEYAMSLLFGTDPQLWKAALASGGHPLADTIWDMIVAAIGVAIFYITLLIDVRTGGKIYRGTLSAERAGEEEGVSRAGADSAA